MIVDYTQDIFGNLVLLYGSITYTARYEPVWNTVASNSGVGAVSLSAQASVSVSTAVTDSVTFGYSSGLSISGSVAASSTTTITAGADSTLNVPAGYEGTIELQQATANVYYDYVYLAPTAIGAPSPTPVTGSYYAGSYLTNNFKTITSLTKLPE